MSEPYLTLGNLHFVPVVRQRLAFAVLVRKALRALEPWDHRDLLAVALPASMESEILKATRKRRRGLMPISQVIASWDNQGPSEGDGPHPGTRQDPGIASPEKQGPFEVFPVTPADGMIEAVRYADENRLPLEWIDQDLVPSHLLSRSCLRDPDWPDDEVALRWGADRYMKMVAPLLEQPPVRFEPVDTWREHHLAERLRVLSPRYRRILVVCEANHLEPVRWLLCHRTPPLHSQPEITQPPRIQIIRPKLEFVLASLDDFPRLVEVYEKQRNSWAKDEGEKPIDHPADFDKWKALFLGIQKSQDKGISTRALINFRQFLQELLQQNGRLSPRFREVEEACNDFFKKVATSRILTYLGGYGEEIEIGRVTYEPAIQYADLVYHSPIPTSGEAHYLQRFCNPEPSVYSVRPHPPYVPPAALSGNYADRAYVISPNNDFMVAMRKKVTTLAGFQERKTRAIPFSGSMHGGLDMRRTLRSFLTDQPTLYVKERRTIKDLPKCLNEPIVWLYQPDDSSPNQDWRLSCTLWRDSSWLDRLSIEYVGHSQMVGLDRNLHTTSDGIIEITEQRVLGRLSFFDGDFNKIRRDLESKVLPDLQNQFEVQIPLHEQHHKHFESMGCMDHSLHTAARDGAAWWDILLLSAVKRALKTVLCVVPSGFRISGLVREQARAERKELLCFHLFIYNHEELRKMKLRHTAKIPEGTNADPAMYQRILALKNDLGIE